MNVKLFISEISIALEDRQLREIISMATNMSNFAKLERFSEFRPHCSVFDDPRAWWRYNAIFLICLSRIADHCVCAALCAGMR